MSIAEVKLQAYRNAPNRAMKEAAMRNLMDAAVENCNHYDMSTSIYSDGSAIWMDTHNAMSVDYIDESDPVRLRDSGRLYRWQGRSE